MLTESERTLLRHFKHSAEIAVATLVASREQDIITAALRLFTQARDQLDATLLTRPATPRYHYIVRSGAADSDADGYYTNWERAVLGCAESIVARCSDHPEDFSAYKYTELDELLEITHHTDGSITSEPVSYESYEAFRQAVAEEAERLNREQHAEQRIVEQEAHSYNRQR